MYVFACMRFQFGSENCFSRAMRAILPVRFSSFSGEKARKSGKGIHFDENLNIFSIFIEIKKDVFRRKSGGSMRGVSVFVIPATRCGAEKLGEGNGSGGE